MNVTGLAENEDMSQVEHFNQAPPLEQMEFSDWNELSEYLEAYEKSTFQVSVFSMPLLLNTKIILSDAL